MNSVYRVEGHTAFTHIAAGPWDPGLQHGGAPASLVCWAAQRIATREPMHIARITLDLLRPVPVAPLEIRTEVLREGRKIQLCAVTLLHDDVAVVRSTVLKIRQGNAALPDTVTEEPLDVPGPEHAPDCNGAFHSGEHSFVSGLNVRFVRGSFDQPGPGAVWFRAHRPIVAGEPITPAMRAAMAADFCNGISSVLDFEHWTFINADLTVSLARLPIGEWILVDAQSWLGPHGAGIAFAKLGDERGYFGRAVQTLVVEKR
jgi:Thioesterase-like superfamily